MKPIVRDTVLATLLLLAVVTFGAVAVYFDVQSR